MLAASDLLLLRKLCFQQPGARLEYVKASQLPVGFMPDPNSWEMMIGLHGVLLFEGTPLGFLAPKLELFPPHHHHHLDRVPPHQRR